MSAPKTVSPSFPPVVMGSGALCALLAAQALPLDMRRIEPMVQAWIARQTLDAISVWTAAEPQGDVSPERHRIEVTPKTHVALVKAMEMDRMTLAVLSKKIRLHADLGGVMTIQVQDLGEVEQGVKEGRFAGLLLDAAMVPLDADRIQGLADRVPVTWFGVEAPSVPDAIPCLPKKGRTNRVEPTPDGQMALDRFLFRAGLATLLNRLERRNARWVLSTRHRWDRATKTVVTELTFVGEEQLRVASHSPDAVPFSEIPATRFCDIIGMAAIKETLMAAVSAHVAWRPGDPAPPKGFLLAGPPGCGKTLMAQALAGEAGLPFLGLAAGSLQDMFYGETERKIRDLFAMARRHRPAIIFLDEVDALAMDRQKASLTNPGFVTSIVTTLLDCMDGFTRGAAPVLVLAATTHPQNLDPAFVRPGRFDQVLAMTLPTAADREAFLKANLSKNAFEKVHLRELVCLSEGMSFADLAQAVKTLQGPAKGGVTLGRLREGLLARLLGDFAPDPRMDEAARFTVALHEAGHAVVRMALRRETPIYLSIRPRTKGTLGITVTLQDQPNVHINAAWILDEMAISLGGRVAEVLFQPHREPGSGASDDLERATELALKAIGLYGLEPAWSGVSMAVLPPEVRGALGAEWADHLKEWLRKANANAEAALRRNQAVVERLAAALSARSELLGEEFGVLLEGVL